METILIANQKGGIGKTTTATAIANVLQKKGYKVLFIDADPQGNSTDTYRANTGDGVTTLYDVILEKENPVNINDAIQHTEFGDIVASDKLLSGADKVLNGDVDGFFMLREAIADLNGYDFSIIDTGPSLNTLLINCLVAADKIVIPITADKYGIQGLSKLYDSINKTKKRFNPNLKISGLLLVQYDIRTILARDVKKALKEIAEQIDTKVFKTYIRKCVKVPEAQTSRELLINYAPKCTSSKDYIELVDEILEE